MVAATILFSFSPKPGGDLVTIYLNDQLLVKQALHIDPVIKKISLEGADADATLRVFYSHCGQIGTSRRIAVTGADNKLLTTWKYADTKDSHEAMTCSVKSITALEKQAGKGLLNLVYYADELPEGKVIVQLSTSNALLSARW